MVEQARKGLVVLVLQQGLVRMDLMASSSPGIGLLEVVER